MDGAAPARARRVDASGGGLAVLRGSGQRRAGHEQSEGEDTGNMSHLHQESLFSGLHFTLPAGVVGVPFWLTSETAVALVLATQTCVPTGVVPSGASSPLPESGLPAPRPLEVNSEIVLLLRLGIAGAHQSHQDATCPADEPQPVSAPFLESGARTPRPHSLIDARRSALCGLPSHRPSCLQGLDDSVLPAGDGVGAGVDHPDLVAADGGDAMGLVEPVARQRAARGGAIGVEQ